MGYLVVSHCQTLTPPKALASSCTTERIPFDESTFRYGLNEDAMATEKLAEGIRNFAKDAKKLEDFIRGRL